jgi:hypothetical protein
MSAATATRPRTKPARSCRFYLAGEDGLALLLITEGKGETAKTKGYFLREFSSPLGRAFKFETFTTDGGNVYEVLLTTDGKHDSCECLAFLKHGHKTECRYLACLKALATRGRI